MHGNNKSPAELDYAIESGLGHIVVDSFDEIERLRGRGQRVLLRVTPGIEPTTHEFIQTGQVDSKFGFQMDEVERAVGACADAGLELADSTPTSAPRSSTWTCSRSSASSSRALATRRCSTSEAASASRTPPTTARRSIEEYVEALLRHAPEGVTGAVRAGPRARGRTPA